MFCQHGIFFQPPDILAAILADDKTSQWRLLIEIARVYRNHAASLLEHGICDLEQAVGQVIVQVMQQAICRHDIKLAPELVYVVCYIGTDEAATIPILLRSGINIWAMSIHADISHARKITDNFASATANIQNPVAGLRLNVNIYVLPQPAVEAKNIAQPAINQRMRQYPPQPGVDFRH